MSVETRNALHSSEILVMTICGLSKLPSICSTFVVVVLQYVGIYCSSTVLCNSDDKGNDNSCIAVSQDNLEEWQEVVQPG